MRPFQTLQEQLVEFHEAFDQPIASSPSVPADDRVRLRARLIAEEFFETMLALFGQGMAVRELRLSYEMLLLSIAHGGPNVSLVELADGLADLDYVVEGTRLEFGIDGAPIAAKVHRSNMAKLIDGKCVKRPDGKIVKPSNWAPPDITGELGRQIQERPLAQVKKEKAARADVGCED